jgi:hypothetical protein
VKREHYNQDPSYNDTNETSHKIVNNLLD